MRPLKNTKRIQDVNTEDTGFLQQSSRALKDTRQIKILAKGVKFQQLSNKLRKALQKDAMKTTEWAGRKKIRFFKNNLLVVIQHNSPNANYKVKFSIILFLNTAENA